MDVSRIIETMDYRLDGNKLVIDGLPYRMKGGILTKLAQLHGVNKRNINNDILDMRRKVLQFQIGTDNAVIRVTGDKFIDANTVLIGSWITDTLKAEGYEVQEKVRSESVRKYLFGPVLSAPKVGDYIPSISFINKNTGNDAIQLSGGIYILKCTNGLMTQKHGFSMSIPHVHDINSLEQKVKRFVLSVIERYGEFVDELVQLQQITLQLSQIEKVLEYYKLPKYLISEIMARVRAEDASTAYDLYQILTNIASTRNTFTVNNRTYRLNTDRYVLLSDMHQLQNALSIMVPVIH
ncbi:MAG: DUF932 domain-containing protein [Candidatus Nitrosocaldaceae archaeon]